MEREQLHALLDRCRDNDRAAQEKVYKHFFLSMFQYARKMVKDDHDAISIINDGFLKAFMNIETFSWQKGAFEAWLRTIITNTAFNHIQKNKRSVPTIQLEEEIHQYINCTATTPKPEFIQSLINNLPPLAKSVLSLNVEGYSHREISTLLSISEMASRWHLSQARKQLKSTLKEMEDRA